MPTKYVWWKEQQGISKPINLSEIKPVCLLCNLIGLEQWYFSLISKTYMWKLQTFCG